MAMEALLENLRYEAAGSETVTDQLPDMFDLPSEEVGEPGLPDEFHIIQAILLRLTFKVSVPSYTAIDMNLYYDKDHTERYKRPDWFGVVGVPPLYQGEMRSSYVVWKEKVRPYIIVEFLSLGTEDEDLGRKPAKPDRPPNKWTVYQDILQVPYYMVYDRRTEKLRAFKWEGRGYVRMATKDDRVSLPEIGLELRTWQGSYDGLNQKWLRFFHPDGTMISTPSEIAELERAEKERERALKERYLAEKEQERAEKERYLALLKKAGIDPNSKGKILVSRGLTTVGPTLYEG